MKGQNVVPLFVRYGLFYFYYCLFLFGSIIKSVVLNIIKIFKNEIWLFDSNLKFVRLLVLD